MGYPHKPHPKETVVLSKHFGEADARTHKGWVKRGGYESLAQALTMEPARETLVAAPLHPALVRESRAGPHHGARPGHRHREGIGAARTGRCRLSDGAQVVLHAQGKEEAALPVRERGRIRARDIQRPRDHAVDTARIARGRRHRGAR